tara:strand:- start:576 stop:962 length:387 start_codon:yes stop_codon:yes gene_type:complete
MNVGHRTQRTADLRPQQSPRYDDCGIPTSLPRNAEDFSFLQYKQISKGGAIPAENLRFMGQLRSGRDISRLRLKRSSLKNRDQDETDKEITPKNINIDGPPSFYEKDFEGFIKRKQQAGKSTVKFSVL